jgi:D-inositol-3-phosphate glycosyltransferase
LGEQAPEVILITGGSPHYEAGLIAGLSAQGLHLQVVGCDELADAPCVKNSNVQFVNLKGDHAKGRSLVYRLYWIVRYYCKAALFIAGSSARVVHIQWPYKLVFFDRTLFTLFFKVIGKKVLLTVHNVDQAARDNRQTWSNKFSLRFLYNNCDHLIVHTAKMRDALAADFGVPVEKMTILPHGLMSEVPESSLTSALARERLKVAPDERLLLFFGLIAPYKGLEVLIDAVTILKAKGERFTLIVAGRVKECADYWNDILQRIEREQLSRHVRLDIRHIPDSEVEVYLKAADVSIMPYREIFQSGVIFLSYRFGLPVIATDVGSLREDIVPGKTGLLCSPGDPVALAKAIEEYFASAMYRDLTQTRRAVFEYACDRYSWDKIARETKALYERLVGCSVGRLKPSLAP